jgi:general secretion pathway protein D
LLEVIKPLIDPRVGVITPYPSANLLVVTDWRSNLARIDALLRQLDQVSDEPVETLTLRHASARDTAKLVNQLLEQEGSAGNAKVVADARSNALLVRGNTSARERVRRLLAQVDVAREHVGNTEVIYLRHARAGDVLKVLRGLGGQDVASSAEAAGADVEGVHWLSNNVSVRGEFGIGSCLLKPTNHMLPLRNDASPYIFQPQPGNPKSNLMSQHPFA